MFQTIGMNAQGDHRQTLVGMEYLKSTRFGTFSFEPALSHLMGRDQNVGSTDFAGKVRYFFTDYKCAFNEIYLLRSYSSAKTACLCILCNF
jgi:hypothetical protein